MVFTSLVRAVKISTLSPYSFANASDDSLLNALVPPYTYKLGYANIEEPDDTLMMADLFPFYHLYLPMNLGMKYWLMNAPAIIFTLII